ncbi:MAG: tetratricopeptide repeat protein [Muribaculaceae bacterium]|nr:tetratricopeptide repeat protein [Muribaculaceae bacterium]
MKIPGFHSSHRTLGKAAIAALAILSPSMAVSQVNAEQVLAIGRNVLSMDDYMLAIQYFNQAIKAKPYLADPYFYRAIAKLSLDDFKGAEADCSLAIERNRFKTEAYKVRGFARQNLGNDSLAIADYNIGLEYNPLDKYFLFYKAVAQTEIKDFDGADNTFALLLRQYPAFEEGFTARGRLNIAKGDTVAALDDLGKAISLSKSLVNPFLLRAEIEWHRKEWQKAGEDMDAAIRLHPEVADLYVNRAFIRYNSDDFFGAMSDYNYTLELDPDNTSALFNRALLRYEVKDLERSEEDLSNVLKLDPGNFHALYNRGLVRLEQDKNKEALSDFTAIASKYPRFYPVYYAMAEAKRNMGDMRTAMQLVYQADDMVKGYVKNPEKNPLDRPAIAAAESNNAKQRYDDNESETEVMNRFNRLVTVSDAVDNQLSYNEKIKGRVQDRNVQVEPEPMYALSFTPSPLSLRSVSNYFRELDDLNQQRFIQRQFYLTPGLSAGSDTKATEELFGYADEIISLIKSGKARPVDRLALGVVQAMLKNYPDAIANLDEVLKIDPRFTVAYMARAYAKFAKILADERQVKDPTTSNDVFDQRAAFASLQDVISDYDMALSLNPRLVFAWFNKGNIYYSVGDYTSAMQCYGEALRIDPDFGQAYFNRGLSYLQAGNKSQAFSDLSKAGELGVLPSYNILKRMK